MQDAFNYLAEYKLDILAYDLPTELALDDQESEMMLDLMFCFVKNNRQWLDELVPACAPDPMGWFINSIDDNFDSYQKETYWKYLSPAMTEWLREGYADYHFRESIANG